MTEPSDVPEFAPGMPVVRPSHTWYSIDLVEAATNPPEPPSIGGLLYPGKRTLISGERDSLKTWLALILAKAELDAGYAVGWADIDAMGAAEIVDRLRLLGIPDEKISSLFLYYAPAERLAGDALLDVAAELQEKQARLFIGDAFNPFLSLHGLDPNSTSDVEAFWREVADPIARAGAAPTLLDHVAKDPKKRGHYAYGSERKASGALVHLGTRIVTPFGRGRIGASAVDCHRDRQGYLPRPKIGLLELAASGPGVAYSLRAEATGDEFRPTQLMEKISRHIEGLTERVPRNAIAKEVTGNATTKQLAVDTLVAEGFARETDGPRGAKLVASIRPYRQDEEPSGAVSLTSSPGREEVGKRSGRSPHLTSSNSLLPLKGEEVEEVGVDLFHETRKRSISVPRLGDDLYTRLIADAVRDGHLTETDPDRPDVVGEAEQQYALHNLVVAAREAAEGSSPT